MNPSRNRWSSEWMKMVKEEMELIEDEETLRDEDGEGVGQWKTD